ncbi:MAG: hypothetical protein F9K32_19565 [Desulfobulbaceae bacterium]|nr:MAG: hypothetical protein F9K32_19565 [Desulfobulbaceae bacterium]
MDDTSLTLFDTISNGTGSQVLREPAETCRPCAGFDLPVTLASAMPERETTAPAAEPDMNRHFISGKRPSRVQARSRPHLTKPLLCLTSLSISGHSI